MKSSARTWSNLSAFKRDTIVAVLRLGGVSGCDPDDRPYGLAIKRELSIMRDEEVHHGRLYPNLDDLADARLLRKGERDKRTNTYCVTDKATTAFATYLTECVGLSVDVDEVRYNPGYKYQEQTSKERGEA